METELLEHFQIGWPQKWHTLKGQAGSERKKIDFPLKAIFFRSDPPGSVKKMTKITPDIAWLGMPNNRTIVYLSDSFLSLCITPWSQVQNLPATFWLQACPFAGSQPAPIKF